MEAVLQAAYGTQIGMSGIVEISLITVIGYGNGRLRFSECASQDHMSLSSIARGPLRTCNLHSRKSASMPVISLSIGSLAVFLKGLTSRQSCAASGVLKRRIGRNGTVLYGMSGRL